MLKIGVKYCGGCNPEYDRVALVEQIMRRLTGKARFVAPEHKGIDIILAVQGCRTACADLSGFGSIEVRTVTDIESGKKFLKDVLNAIDE